MAYNHCMSEAAEAAVHVVPYDASWPTRFDAERTIVAGAIHQWVVGGIEHVGSTAVPGLVAKPVIDMMAGVLSLDASRAALPRLERIGYCYAPYRAEVMHWLCKPSPALRTHHLHLVPFESRLWIERLAFRDYLRAHPDATLAYAELKRRLAAQHEFDREAYTEAKGPFIQEIVERALADRERVG